jgi:hypothetical protein
MSPEDIKPQEDTEKVHHNVFRVMCASISPKGGSERGDIRNLMNFHLKSEIIGESDAVKVNRAYYSKIDIFMKTLDSCKRGLLRRSNFEESFKSLIDEQDLDSKA